MEQNGCASERFAVLFAEQVSAPDVEWTFVQRLGGLVHERFDGEVSLGTAEAALRAAEQRGCITHGALRNGARNVVATHGAHGGKVANGAREIFLGAAIEAEGTDERLELAAIVEPDGLGEIRFRAFQADLKLFIARLLPAQRPLCEGRGEREINGKIRLVAAAKSAAWVAADHVNVLDVDIAVLEHIAYGFAVAERRLCTEHQIQTTGIRLKPRQPRLRLHEDRIDGGRFES